MGKVEGVEGQPGSLTIPVIVRNGAAVEILLNPVVVKGIWIEK